MSDNIYKFKRPEPPKEPMFRKPGQPPAVNVPPILLVLCGIFFAIHIVRQILPLNIDDQILQSFAFNPIIYGADFGLPSSIGFLDITIVKLIAPFTYNFLHADWMHVIMNSLWFVAFGAPVAWRFGAYRFVMLCLVAGIGGALLHAVFHIGSNAPMVGASAASSGAMAASLRFAFSGATSWMPATDPARYQLPAPGFKEAMTTPTVVTLMAVWFAINIFFSLGAIVGGGSVAWQAHIGGFITGLFAFDLLDPIRRAR